jgi:hypothetical protein
MIFNSPHGFELGMVNICTERLKKRHLSSKSMAGPPLDRWSALKMWLHGVASQYREGWTKMAIVVSAMTGETNRSVALVNAVNPNSPAKAYDMAVASGEQVSVAPMGGSSCRRRRRGGAISFAPIRHW